jgi:hypothetical protein
MAEPPGKTLTLEQMTHIQRWMAEKQANQHCPACLFQQWTIGESLVLEHVYIPRGGIVLGGGYPAVVLFCNRCGFMRLHNAIAVGIVEPDAPAGAKAETKNGTD